MVLSRVVVMSIASQDVAKVKKWTAMEGTFWCAKCCCNGLPQPGPVAEVAPVFTSHQFTRAYNEDVAVERIYVP